MYVINYRQQRDEIARKKEKLESMLKGKKSQQSVRPESPNSRRRRSLKRTTMPSRRLSGSRNSCSEVREPPCPLGGSQVLGIVVVR